MIDTFKQAFSCWIGIDFQWEGSFSALDIIKPSSAHFNPDEVLWTRVFRKCRGKVVHSVLSVSVVMKRQITDETILLKISKDRTSVSCFTQKSNPKLSLTDYEIQYFLLFVFWLVFCFQGMNGKMNCATLCI